MKKKGYNLNRSRERVKVVHISLFVAVVFKKFQFYHVYRVVFFYLLLCLSDDDDPRFSGHPCAEDAESKYLQDAGGGGGAGSGAGQCSRGSRFVSVGGEVRERSCDSLIMCIVTTLNQGLRNGGGIGDILRAPASFVTIPSLLTHIRLHLLSLFSFPLSPLFSLSCLFPFSFSISLPFSLPFSISLSSFLFFSLAFISLSYISFQYKPRVFFTEP